VSYVTVAELRGWLGIGDAADDALLSQAVDTAAAWIDEYCGETFVVPTAATARLFHADGWNLVRVDTFASTTGLVVATDDNDDGTAETTWTITTDYILEDANGRTVGEAQGPYRSIRAVGARSFPCSSSGRPLVSVTARWGWPATPAPVKQAAYVLAAEQWKQKDAPFGVAAFGEFGALRVRANPVVAQLLAPYRRAAVVA
jgi:hypothetical protein